jgi:hypothetical protein
LSHNTTIQRLFETHILNDKGRFFTGTPLKAVEGVLPAPQPTGTIHNDPKTTTTPAVSTVFGHTTRIDFEPTTTATPTKTKTA